MARDTPPALPRGFAPPSRPLQGSGRTRRKPRRSSLHSSDGSAELRDVGALHREPSPVRRRSKICLALAVQLHTWCKTSRFTSVVIYVPGLGLVPWEILPRITGLRAPVAEGMLPAC